MDKATKFKISSYIAFGLVVCVTMNGLLSQLFGGPLADAWWRLFLLAVWAVIGKAIVRELCRDEPSEKPSRVEDDHGL